MTASLKAFAGRFNAILFGFLAEIFESKALFFVKKVNYHIGCKFTVNICNLYLKQK